MKDLPNTEDKLFSKFGHDLRGAFVSILGYTELLKDPDEKITGQELIEFVNRIDFRTKEVYELLDNFLNWLKLERYNKKLLPEKNSLFDSIAEAKLSFDKVLKEKSVSIINEIKSGTYVFIDLQILQGLLKNIFRFISINITPKTSLKISFIDYPQNIIIKFNFTTKIDELLRKELLSLNSNNLEVRNIPNEILFAKKFTELSMGKFELLIEEDSKTKIILSLPKK